MLVYRDLLTDDELLSDSFPYKEIENGMLWEVDGKWVTKSPIEVDIAANPSAKGSDEEETVEDKAVKVVDIVDSFLLQEKTSFDKTQFRAYMEQYADKLASKLHGKKQDELKQRMDGAIKYIESRLEKMQIFVGESMHENTSPVFAYCKEGATDPTFLYLAYALTETEA
ncbi:translationally-controlled tumor protein homolog [Wolffia australiana]